jgi:predicted AAA+ superfamily ATPase
MEPVLSAENPWWKSKDEILSDIKIKEWNESKLKWDPRIRHKFDYSTDIIYSLRGPRQVGKTTLIKLQIRDFLQNTINPWNIMYYAFDLDNNPRDVLEIINSYLTQSERWRDKTRCYLFLDEISSVKNWQKAIKKLSDMGKLKNCTVVATGSHTVDLRMATERLPGRKGITDDAYDKIMLPMKFSEYVSVLDAELAKFINENLRSSEIRKKIFNKLFHTEIDPALEKLIPQLDKLDRYLYEYLLTGGIPKAIDDYIKYGQINEYVYTTYLESILGDIQHLDIDARKFKKLVGNIIDDIGWPTSWNSLQKDTDIGSWSTVDRYMNLLSEMFIVIIYFQYDSKKKAPLYDKAKKLYFQDVFFFHTLNSWINSKKSFDLATEYVRSEKNQGHLIEGIIGNHLIRLAFFLSPKKQMFDFSNQIFYWRYSDEREVDFIFKMNNVDIPIEVKYQKNITSRDIDGLFNFKSQTGVKNALLISKKDLSIKNNEYVKIPASLFLVLV